MKKIAALMVLGLLIGSNSIQAESLKDQVPVTKTELEKFSARTGVVIVQGFEEIGSHSGLHDTSARVNIDSKVLIIASTGEKKYGITIKVTSGKRENTSFIEYDEIDSLIKGIDYISKVDTSATNFSDFQAEYKTKGNFKIATFSQRFKVLVAVSSGGVSAHYVLSDLSRIKELIIRAKKKIDSAKE